MRVLKWGGIAVVVLALLYALGSPAPDGGNAALSNPSKSTASKPAEPAKPAAPPADVKRTEIHRGETDWAHFKEEPGFMTIRESRADQMELAENLRDAQCSKLDLCYLSFESGEWAIIVITEEGLRKDAELSYEDGIYLWRMT
jgi:hypothetical protein